MTELSSFGVADVRRAGRAAFAVALCLCSFIALAQTAPAAGPRTAAAAVAGTADYIVAVVNQELVTNAELQGRVVRIREEAERNKTALPPAAELRKQVLDALIDERVQVTNARETGPKIDEAELDRAVMNVAVQNQMTLAQLRARLQQQGLAYSTFRNNVRDQILTERVREREVNLRIRIGGDEVDALIEKRRAAVGTAVQVNIAQILVTVPEGATEDQVAQRRARAEAALARVKSGESFEAVAREVSEDANKAQGGVIGLRPVDRLPDLFVEVVRNMKPGDVAPALLRSGAGFHAIKLVERNNGAAFTVQQTRARHILLRVSPQLTAQAAGQRLIEFKRQIQSGAKTFEQLARENSEDGSAAQGGDLGWTAPGTFVPEFEVAMNALPLNGMSEPLVSRFGVHLIQVMERRQVALDLKQQREQARNVLREQRFEEAYLDWVRDLRARAYIEMREAPQ
ncbi:MAG: peptidylprolyl isomerase [Rhizobacter sp.]|nr:peptidylprolyl isomerase [Rhizobacter sp.]